MRKIWALQRSKQTNDGLTLTELLVTLAVLAIIAALAFPILRDVTINARSSSSALQQELVAAFDEQWSSYRSVGPGAGSEAGNRVAYEDVNGNGQHDDGEPVTARLPEGISSTNPGSGNSNSGSSGATSTQATGMTSQISSATSLFIDWVAPANNGGSAITGYMMQYSTDPLFVDNVMTVPNWSATSAGEIFSLTTGARYYVRVAPVNANGTGNWSSSISDIPGDEPWAPITISAVLSGQTATLSWAAAVENGYAVTGYTIVANPSAGLSISVDNEARTATVTGLSASTGYWFKVSATNALGTSDYSSASNTVTTGALPGAPTNPIITVTNSTSFGLGWSAPGSNGGSDITGYRIKLATDAAFTTGVQTIDTDTLSTYRSFTGMVPGTTYYAKVAATTASGTGAYSTATGSGTTWGAPAQITSLTAVKATATTASLTWTLPAANGSAIYGYRITRSTSPGMTANVVVTNTGTTARSATVTGLTAGVTYYYTVSAINTIGAGEASSPASATQ